MRAMNRELVCHKCGRPVNLDEVGWLVYWDRKAQRSPTKRVWWECPDHTPHYEQLMLF
jgi:hypothetical protein